jgi:two-component system, NtrC family, sensor histidine kinase KinB
MKIKKKLFLGFGLLFIVVVCFGAVSLYYIEEISQTSKVTLKNNYETLTFTRDMRSVLDENDLPLSAPASETFDNALKKQENNITERGEKEATASVRKSFGLLIDPSSSLNQKQQIEGNIRLQLKKIDGLNMQAIVKKNNFTHTAVDQAALYLGGMGFITFLILFILIANFPGFILNPLSELKEALQDVNEKNYDTRLEFNTSNEFTQLATAFNTMAEGLDKWENTLQVEIFSERERIKTLVEETDDAVICLNEKQEFLFVNAVAKEILNLNEKQVIGKPINGFIEKNNLLEAILDNKDETKPLKVTLNGKVSLFQKKSIEIVVPNLKPSPFDSIQLSGYSVGMIYILKNVTEFKEHDIV